MKVFEPKTRDEFAHLYNFSCRQTFMRHLTAHGILLPRGRRLLLQDQLLIFSRMGLPPTMAPADRDLLKPLLEEYCNTRGITPP